MTRKQEASGSLRRGSNQVVKTEHSGSGTSSASELSKAETVTPTSERIIKATSVKRRIAMKVLADR